AAFRPQVVHAHDSHALVVALLARALAAFSVGAGDRGPPPRIVATRRVDFSIRRRIGPSPWRRADRVIAISDAVKAVLVADGLPPARIAVVPSGIDPDEVRRAATAPLDVRRRLGLPPDAPLAVNVAALVDHKDQRTLIRAAHAARALRPDLHWAVAGEGELRRALANEIGALGLGDLVHLLGYVAEADALIREADVFVMSSKEEGLGSVVLHALALGRPVVATRGGGLPEVLPAECLVPVGDHAALAHAVVAALDHPPGAPLPARYTAEAMARGVMEVYRRLTTDD
ncbi:MAG: glycosyltransferase, partial [Gemmatimonadales bacterium]